MTERITRAALVHRHVYELRSRNLLFGAWREDRDDFVGIRTKFDSRYLDSEVLNDPPGSGTANAFRDTNVLVPDEIGLETYAGSQCGNCGKRAWWTGPPAPAPWACDGGCEETLPFAKGNPILFAFLEAVERDQSQGTE